MMLDGFITLLTDDTAVNALVDGRIHKKVLPRGYVLPALVIHRYGGSQEYQSDGPVALREDQLQVDCYAAYPDSAEVAEALSEAVRAAMENFTGILPEGTVVQACYLDRTMDMPFLPNADPKSISNRSLLGFRVISVAGQRLLLEDGNLLELEDNSGHVLI